MKRDEIEIVIFWAGPEILCR